MKTICAYVWQEPDYTVFKKLLGNRDVSEDRKNIILASMSEKEILNPIIVNGNMEIIEGQGRFEALRELGRPIKYVVDETAGRDDCIRLNRANTKWVKLDYANCYANSGNVNYINLLRAVDLTGESITTILIYSGHSHLLHNNVKTSYGNDFEQGKLIFTDADICEVQRIQKIVSEIKTSLLLDVNEGQYFSRAIQIVANTEGYQHSRMLRNCERLRSTFSLTGKLERQLVEFERIYNFRMKGEKLCFSDYMKNKGHNVRDYNNEKKPSKNVQTLS